jgi:glucosamine kinase
MTADLEKTLPKTHCVLGLDVGGTQTRWALTSMSGAVLSQGLAAGFSAARIHVGAERDQIRARVQAVAAQAQAASGNQMICALHAGVTGIGSSAPQLAEMLSEVFATPVNHIVVTSDVEVIYRGALAPGEGYLVYAGTGSIAAFVDHGGTLHRAGGRGVILDDAGGGYWIAREALRRIWRREDEQPGVWKSSPMAQALFAEVGGDSSIFSARYLMEQERGVIGRLALVVTAHAEIDELAAAILRDAGWELARLARAMSVRYGERKIVVAGRASTLHPLIESEMRRALAPDAVIEFRQIEAHMAAARLAAKNVMKSTGT